jgi:hypothetical protein
MQSGIAIANLKKVTKKFVQHLQRGASRCMVMRAANLQRTSCIIT